jgi:hypothetical protein
MNFTDEKQKLWSEVLFICELPDNRKIACNIRMGFSYRILKLGLKPYVLSKLISVSEWGNNNVCIFQQCIRLNCSSDIINTTLRNTSNRNSWKQAYCMMAN